MTLFTINFTIFFIFLVLFIQNFKSLNADIQLSNLSEKPSGWIFKILFSLFSLVQLVISFITIGKFDVNLGSFILIFTSFLGILIGIFDGKKFKKIHTTLGKFAFILTPIGGFLLTISFGKISPVYALISLLMLAVIILPYRKHKSVYAPYSLIYFFLMCCWNTIIMF